MAAAPVAITGIGAVTGFGRGVEPLWRAAVEGRTCIENGLGAVSPAIGDDIRREFALDDKDNQNLALLFSLSAIREAMAAAGWSHLEPTDGLILATTTGQIPLWDRLLIETLQHRHLPSFQRFAAVQPLGSLLKNIEQQLNFSGPSLLLTSACSASTQALGVAKEWLASGRVRRVLVGGTEVLCDLTVQGFSCLQLLSRERCKPFDSRRTGINLSEGSAFLCLEKADGRAQALLTGHGISLDGYHPTAPHPEGDGTVRAARAALREAAIEASELSWIHAHGTGSTHNDLAEGNAFCRVSTKAPVSSTKAIHGHALGAVGAIESVLIVKALKEQFILRTANLDEPDEKIAVSHVEKSAKAPLKHVLKNTAGFGGSNAALVFSHA